MTDALWELFCKIFDADNDFCSYCDKLHKIYDEVPYDLRDEFVLLKNRLVTSDEIRQDLTKLLTKIKEAILEHN